MNEINMNLIDKYKKRKAYQTGATSVAIVLTGLIEVGKEYVTWKGENGDIILREVK